jgi:UDP-N-acetylmuramyl pentapeptide phosphotransferase/UDP-N-acetylglucosamine-1-phosphate transferase
LTSALLALVLPFSAAAAIGALLLRSPWALRLADHPNERSLHSRATPRIGGIAIVMASFPAAFAVTTPAMDWLWALALGLALVSFADDLRSLPIAVRLPAHFAAAAIAATVIAPTLPFAMLLVAAIVLAWMTNLYNFMDGSDGLAAGMAAIGFGAYAIAAWQSGLTPLALACASLASAATGFLCFNFPPARAFMGDAGSIPLGFLAGALGGYGMLSGAWPAWFPLLVFSPFVVDASLTIARRILRRERFWMAHRSHAYQRLVLSGWSPRRLAVCAYALMTAAAASALLVRAAVRENQYAILAVWSLLYLVAWLAVERRKPPRAPRHEGAHPGQG